MCDSQKVSSFHIAAHQSIGPSAPPQPIPAPIPAIASNPPTVAITKTGDLTATTSAPDNTIDYVIDVPNSSSGSSIGLPLINMGLVISETIPPSTTYQAGSAAFVVSGYVPATPPGADTKLSTYSQPL